jgi:hypothetical protein
MCCISGDDVVGTWVHGEEEMAYFGELAHGLTACRSRTGLNGRMLIREYNGFKRADSKLCEKMKA